jgi:uncharacterized membrane protein
MSQESTVNKLKKTSYTILGPIIGASIALLLSELGFEVATSMGYILGLCIGLGIDNHKNEKRA